MKTISLGEKPPEYSPVKIGSGVYLGPQTVIQKGVVLGDRVVVGACSFVNRSFQNDAKVWGSPAREIV